MKFDYNKHYKILNSQKHNINENGMWLFFDIELDLNFIWHHYTLNMIHIFNLNSKIPYQYIYDLKNFHITYGPPFTFLKNIYSNIQIYKTNHINHLTNLIKTKNPITFLYFSLLWQDDCINILEICKENIVSSCNIYIIDFFDKQFSNVKKWLTDNCEYSMQNNIITIQKNKNTSKHVLDIYNKTKNYVKVINKRKGGYLWHYGHFFPDCLIDEFNLLFNLPVKNVIRLDNSEQSIGTFNKIYENVIKKKNIEYKLDKFNEVYSKTKLIIGYFQGPYPNNYFDKIYKYIISNFYNKKIKKYDIILIERGSQKLKYDTKTLKIIYNKNKTIEYVTSTGKNRRSINDHNKLKKYLESKYNDKFKNIILEDLSFSDQITYFNNAKFIIAQHGAGLFNLVFCKENTSILEIEPILVQVFKNIADTKKLKYNSCKNEFDDIILNLK